MNFIEIQSWPEVPSISLFSSLFSSSFNLPDFDIEDLEEALLLDSSENNSIDDSSAAELAPRLIPELIVSLLRGCDLVKSWPSITTSNYQMFLRRLLRHKCEEYNIENPFNTDTDFHSLSLRTKVVVLNYLCDFRLDSVDVELITSNLEADSLRIEPLGYDSNDSVYWYFFGTRLYREDLGKSPDKKKGSSRNSRIWQVICFTEEDWQSLANKFKNSKSRKEISLYKILTEDFLPNIPVLFKAKEAERRRRLFQRRSSQRVKGLLERRKDKKGSDDNLPILSEEDGDSKLTLTEKYLEEREKAKIEKSKIREKIQNERALRAQRRSSSLSSSSSSAGSSCSLFNRSSFHQRKQDNCWSNKENILHPPLEIDTNKMPPTSVKLPGRQTNNSLSSITGQIVIETPVTNSPGPSTSRKKKVKTEVFIDDEVLQIGMHKVLQTVKNQDDAWPFMDPVEEDIAPRYYSIIKRPMDLLKMEEKLDNGEYRTYTEFRTDFKLIVNNCRLYNGQNNEYTEMVNNLQLAFDRATKKYFDQTSSDEEPVLLEYPPIESSVGRLNLSKEKDSKKDKLKAKDKKHSKKVASDQSSEDEEKKLDENISQKKVKELKRKTTEEPVEKIDKKESRSDTSDKKKDKSTKGVKRKHKDKDKSEKPKAKKIKRDDEDNKKEDFKFDSENDSKSERFLVEAISSENKKIKNIKERTSEIKSTPKTNKKNKKSEVIISTIGKRKTNDDTVLVEAKKKSKKDSPIKSDKFSKTNEKANKKKQKLEKSNPGDSESDTESVHDLIDEIKKSVNKKKIETKKNKGKEHSKKSRASTSTPKKDNSKPSTMKKQNKISSNDDAVSMSSGSFSRSPSPLASMHSSAITDDLTNSFDNDTNALAYTKKKVLESSFRSDTPEIKDKFDLIKERRNKMNQEKEKAKKNDLNQTADSQTREKNHKLKETIEKLKIKKEKSKSQIEFMDEVLGGKIVKKECSNLFDKLKNEELTPDIKNSSKKESEFQKDPQSNIKKSKPDKPEEKINISKANDDVKPLSKNVVSNSSQNNRSKKQNKACLDVLDMETEQTLKDINKWLEHTPRFEYSSASNSPSRYIIDEIDMPSKMDDNDFRKPIPLMPSSPSASNTHFQANNAPKDFNLLKESNNNKQAGVSQNPSVASTSHKKVGSKEPKRKTFKEKLQQLPRKKEVQRTIDRLQPGKTKGNLLHNIQNINKPEEFFPLGGNREKMKEVKNSLIVKTDDSSPKLSLGTVLDTQAFNFNEMDSKKQDNECFDEIKIENENITAEDEHGSFSNNLETEGEKSSEETKKDSQAIKKESDSKTNADASVTKPNINAWFKAFGAPKKPKKSESQDDSGKVAENNDLLAVEGSYFPTHQRRLSTGSSMSERSSVEDSPQVGLEERLGAPAPYPSPIGASPILASPKTDDVQKASSNYSVNGSVRVGFYQDMTSTKSSPEKSCSPREMPSPYSQYSQPQHHYTGSASGAGSGVYGSFYNPESSPAAKQAQQVSYSKPTTSPASYYDQYKQPLSQESDFNNSMSPSTNPNSPYHSQQSSPYQQQPNSPFQSPASGGSGSNSGVAPSNIPQTPAQNQNTSFNNQNATFPQVGQNTTFNQLHQNDQFSTASSAQQNCPKTDWTKPNANNSSGSYGINSQPNNNSFSMNLQSQAHLQNLGPQIPRNTMPPQQHQQSQPHMASSENSFVQNLGNFGKKSTVELQTSGTPSTTPLYGTSKLPDMANVGYSGIEMAKEASKEILPPTSNSNKQADNSKYLDLSKQQALHNMNHHQTNQYQQMFDLSNYAKAPLDFDISKNKSAEMYNRSNQKNSVPLSTTSCAATSNFWGNTTATKTIETSSNYAVNHSEGNKMDLAGKQPVNSLSTNNFTPQHQHSSRNPQPAAMDMNYKQPLFNNPTASSMMDLTAFMRDFRQAEERFSSLQGTPSSFYDKNITPAHMFGKNLQQTNSSAALQQMFNSSMTTMAYNREQQNMNLANYHSRLNTPQNAVGVPNQSHAALNSQVPETKAKKQRKKKNASPEAPSSSIATLQNQQLQQQHQTHNQHSQHQQLQHQQLAHQQSFQSYSGLKIPSATPSGTDPSSISLKSVVPGSAFNYGPTPLTGLYGENPAYLDEFRTTPNPYYPPPVLGHRSTPDPAIDKASANPPPAHPQAPSSPYHHLLPPHHPSMNSRSYPFMNSLDPAALQQQYRMMLNQSYQAGYHPALGMHNQPPHWPHHM